MRRMSRVMVLLAVGLSILSVGVVLAEEEPAADGPPRPVVRGHVDAIQQLVESRNDESINRFIAEHFAPALRNSKKLDEWVVELKEVRRLYVGNGTIRLQRNGATDFAIHFGECAGEGVPLNMSLDPAAPHLITGLQLGERTGSSPRPIRDQDPTPITWDRLRARLEAEQAAGFCGSVLVVRDGKVFLHEGYGLANREKSIPNKPDTIFAIGSTPIDFTKAAILKLEDMGKLSTTDPITNFLTVVPADKRSITIDQLMTGRSGLRDFLGRPEDTDPDNMWIDRETALKRILEDELRFAPGTDRAHSHAAFGLLAAIVEIVSGQPYARFLDQHLFGPAGMKHTGHYEDVRASDDDVALGYGGKVFATPNSPLHWGKTSWLVLGSGGMVSTTGDLYRWNHALRSGKLLSPRALRKYWAPQGAVLAGGSGNGFECAYTEGSDAPDVRSAATGSIFVLCTNEIGRAATQSLIRSLAQMVNAPPFRLGVLLHVQPDGVIVTEVQSDTPAHRAGLQNGDRLLAANDEPLNSENLGQALQSRLASGEPVRLKVKRGDATIEVTVTPESTQ